MTPSDSKKDAGQSQMHPGDEARPGTPGSGENICRTCKGSGKVDHKPCPDCAGTGKVTEGIGGG